MKNDKSIPAGDPTQSQQTQAHDDLLAGQNPGDDAREHGAVVDERGEGLHELGVAGDVLGNAAVEHRDAFAEINHSRKDLKAEPRCFRLVMTNGLRKEKAQGTIAIPGQILGCFQPTIIDSGSNKYSMATKKRLITSVEQAVWDTWCISLSGQCSVWE